MSSLKRKLEGEVEIRETGADAHHDIFKNKIHHVSNVASHVQGVDLHEGDHGNIGSIHVWNYTLGGKPFVAKSILEEIDEEKKLVRYRCLEGDVLNEYKSMVATCQVIPNKDKESCVVRWTLEYEKQHPGIPEPTDLLDAWLAASKDIDDHHHGTK